MRNPTRAGEAYTFAFRVFLAVVLFWLFGSVGMGLLFRWYDRTTDERQLTDGPGGRASHPPAVGSGPASTRRGRP